MDQGYADAAVARRDADLASMRELPGFAVQLVRMQELTGERVPSTRMARTARLGRSRTGPVAIAPGGDRIVHGLADGRMLVLDADTGEEQARWDALPDAAWSLAISPDGELLAALSYGGTVGVFDVGTGAPLFLERVFEPEEYRYPFGALVAFDPSGERLLVGAADRGAVLWSRDGALLRRIERPLGDFFGSRAVWSPDGERIATVEGSEVVFLDGRSGEVLDKLVLSTPVHSVSYSPDGMLLAVGTEDPPRVDVVELATGETQRCYSVRDWFRDGKYVPVVRFSPDGALLAYSSATGITVMLDRVRDGAEIFSSGHLGGRMGERVEVRFSPDGSRLWFHWSSGCCLLDEVLTATGERRQHAVGSGPPQMARGGAAVARTWGGLLRFDANTGEFLWHRVELPGGGHLMQAPAGYLSGVGAATAGLVQDAKYEELLVRDRLEVRFDPKRVRAAVAGVPLLAIEE